MGNEHRHEVVIIGGGFGGLYTAKHLKRSPVAITLLDKKNFHLFQPLLYQVATGGLSPGDISSPLRAILKNNSHARVWQADATDIDVANKTVILRDGEVRYDTLVVATGVSHHYFGNDQWADAAPGLKTVEDALHIRRRIFLAFEAAERESNRERRKMWMNFVVVGGGPTGVELAGAVAELAHGTLTHDFREIQTADARIMLVEGMDRILPPYPPSLSDKARKSLERIGVSVMTNSVVTNIHEKTITIKTGGSEQTIEAGTTLWAAGVKASGMGALLARKTGVATDEAGRVLVEPDLTVNGFPEIFVIGDLASFRHQSGGPLPGVAPVAMQQGRHVADAIQRRLLGQEAKMFHYRNKGSLAVIGRNAAVADFGRLRLSGHSAWLTWIFVHIWYLIEFDNKLLVMIQWSFDYFSRKRGARLITGKDPQPLVRRD